MNPTQK